MLSSKKSKLLTTRYSLLIFGGIFLSLFFAIAIVISHSSASAQGLAPSDPTGTGLATGSLIDTALNIINAALALAGIIAVSVLIYGGYVWMTSGGIPQRIALAKKILISAAVGFFFILISWAIVNFVINGATGGGGGGPGGVGPGPLPGGGGSSSLTVKWTDPKDGDSDIPLCRIFQAGFNKNINTGTVNKDNVAIKISCDAKHPCDPVFGGQNLGTCAVSYGTLDYCTGNIADLPGVQWNFFDALDNDDPGPPLPDAFEFIPPAEWEADRSYWVKLGAGITNLAGGTNLSGKTDYVFSVGNTTDNTPPTVANIYPNNGDINICRLKPISAAFSEPMKVSSLKDSVTLSVADNDYASFEISLNDGSIQPADLTFGSFIPDPLSAIYSPKKPYKKNTKYFPILRAGEDADGNKKVEGAEDINGNGKPDGIQDACGNFLDQTAGAPYGSPWGDYGDAQGDPDDAPVDYSFTTDNADDIQCDPQIDLVTTSPFYYDPPNILTGNTGEMVIQGKNFGATGEVNLPNGIVINNTTNSCLDQTITSPNEYTDTGRSCRVSWADNQIVIIAPAEGGSSNGAVDGPLWVNLGGTGVCDLGNTNQCLAGQNKGQACASNDECPINVSNKSSIDIASPHISKMYPTAGPKGQWITLKGIDFGITQGTVRFINTANRTQWVAGNFPCTASWSDTSIIVELPIDAVFGPGDIEIQIERSDGRHSNFGTFTVNTDPLGPGICSISRSCGEIGTTFNIEGKRFGAVKEKVILKNNNPSAVPLETEADLATAAWDDESITGVKVPAGFADGNYSVLVRMAGPPVSNSNGLPFDKPCPGTPCDGDTIAPLCQPDQTICDAIGPTYSCDTTICRCVNNPLPKVVEQNSCILGTQSPSPYRNQTDACLNADISVRFDRDMDNTTLIKENIVIESCGTDQSCAAPTSLTAVWVTRYFGSRVRKFNSATGAVVNDFLIATFPWNVAYNPAQNEMWVPHSGPGSPLRKYDAITGAQVGGDISNNGNPSDVVYDDKQNVMWATYSGANNLRKFNATTGIQIGGNIVTGLNPSSVAYDSAQNAVWVVNYSSNTLQKFNAASGAQVGVNIATGINPEEVVYDPTQNALWVTNRTSNTLQKFNAADGTQIGGDINTGQTPRGITYDPAQNAVWVVNSGGLGALQKFNAATGVQVGVNIATGGNPSDVVYDSAQNAVWVAAYGTNTVRKYSAVDGTQIGGNIATPDSPFRIAYSSPWTVSSPFIWGANGKEGITINVAPSILVSDTYYRVTLKQGIKANDYPLDGNGNGIPDGPGPGPLADDYSWIFKTSNDSCKVKSIALSPANMLVVVSSLKPISAIPQAENCNTLNASLYNWSWTQADATIATVTNSVVPNQNQTVKGEKAGTTTVSASIPAEPAVSVGTSNITVTNKLSCSDAGLAAVWKFDEAAGDAAVDSTDNNNQGVLQNSPTRLSTGCKFGKCLDFDGTDDYVSVTSSAIDSISSNFTVETWFYAPEVHIGIDEPFISKATYANATDNSGFLIGPWASVGARQQIGFNLFNNSIIDIRTKKPNGDPLYLDEMSSFPGWHHVAGTYDGSVAKLYLDGNLVDQGNLAGGIRTNSIPISIGRHSYGALTPFKGRLDEVRIWNKALDISEIKSIYKQQCEALDKIYCSDPNLKAVWKLDENSGIAANDSTSNNNDGQLNGGVVWEAADCQYAPCAKLDGSNDHINILNSPSININGAGSRLTFETWVKVNSFAGPEVWQTIIHKGNGLDADNGASNCIPPNCQNRQYALFLHDSGDLQLASTSADNISIGQTAVNTGAGTVVVGQWYHLAGVIDSVAGIMKIYVNGVEKASSTYSNAGIRSGSGGLFWGNAPDEASPLNGAIDEPRVWDKALTQEEIISAMSQECKAGATGATLQCTNDVAGLWNFDEGGESFVGDGSRYRNNGMLIPIQTALWSTGCQFGGCVKLDGTTQYIDVPNSASLNFGDGINDKPFTFSAWIKRSNLTADNIIVSKYNSQANPYRQQYIFSTNPAGRLVVAIFDTVTPLNINLDQRRGVLTSTQPLNNYNWHHVAATYDGSKLNNGLKLYVDGVEQVTTVLYDELAFPNYVAMDATSESVKIGRNTDSGGAGNYFPGTIDEVRIYNRALSATEIANTYQKSMTQCVEATLMCSNPELTAVWKMDEGIGVVAGDSTANNLDGALKNGLNNTGWKSGADCKFTDGKCLEFDGIQDATNGDYIEVSNSSIFDLNTQPFTIEGWIKRPSGVLDAGTIIAKQSSGNLPGFAVHINSDGSTGRLYFRVNTDADYTGKTIYSPPIDDGAWHHFAVVREGTAIRMYIDGFRAGQDLGGAFLNEANASSVQNVTNSFPLNIGAYDNGGTLAKFKGSLDELRIWKKALTDNQIQSIYNGGNGQQCLAPQKGSACDLDLTAPMCQPNVGLCESGDPDLRCSIKSCTCQEAFTVSLPQPDPENNNPNFTRDSSTVNTDGNFFNDIACRNTAITVNFNEPIDAATIKTAKTTVKVIDPPILSESFDALPIWTEVNSLYSPHWPVANSGALTWNIGIINGSNALIETELTATNELFIRPAELPSITNYRISFEAGTASIGSDLVNALGFVWGFRDDKNYYQLLWEDPTDAYASGITSDGIFYPMPTRLRLQKMTDGIMTDLAIKDPFAAAIKQAVRFTIEVRGTNISVSANGKSLISHNDSSAPAILPVRIGFYAYSSDGGVFYDNLTINEIAPTVAPGTVELIGFEPATGNLLADGDMERTDTDVWKTYNTPAVLEKTTSSKHGGLRSLRVTTDDGVNREGVYAFGGVVNGGDKVRVHTWCNVPGGSMNIWVTNDIAKPWAAVDTTRDVSDPCIGSGWKELALDWWPTFNGAFYVAFISTPDNSNEFYLDDVSIAIERSLPVDIATSVNGSQLTISPRQFLDPSRNYTLNFAGDHLVSLWNFEEASGTTVKDLHGTNNGTLVGPPLWKSGADCKFGSCLEFDGKDGVIQYVNAGDFTGKYSDRLTVSAWIKNNSSRVGMSGNNAGWDDIIAGDCGNFVFAVANAGKVKFQNQCGFRPGTPQGGVVSDKSVNDDRWHHVAATYDGSTMRMYVDGKPDGTPFSASGSFQANVDSGIIWIGSTFYNEELFSGRIDDARIWSRALTDKEIADVAKGGAPNPGNGNVIFSSNGNPLEDDYVWDFDTGTEICKIGKAEIAFSKDANPDSVIFEPITYKGSDFFTCAGNNCTDDFDPVAPGNNHGVAAIPYSVNGGILAGPMDYKWTPSTNAPFSINFDDIPLIEASSKPTNGQGTLGVKIDQLDGSGAVIGTAKASANITVALCENPWPAVPPFQDVPAATSTNFSLWYCRDAGAMQDITDDLPDLTVQEVTMSPGSPKPMKEYFYYDANSVNDAIGIRVYANPSRLPLTEWLDQNANVSGGQSGMFNGWQSVKAGRSLYVSAMNDVGSGIYNNIYLISYSDKSSSILIGIYNQMIGNWKFMVNGISDENIAKLQRDIRRIDDLGKIATALDSYKTKNGSYPKLDAGTYLPGMSTSVWPSWQASFGNALQTSIPKDPINQLSNLMAWWKFDEGTGIAAKDSSINAFDGRIEGNDIKWTPASDCKVGGCLDFGTQPHSSVIRVPREAVNGLNDLTTEFWVKAKLMTNGGSVISGAYGTTGLQANEFTWILNNGKITPAIKGAGYISSVVVGDDQWHHTAMSRENGVIRLYVDGVLRQTKPDPNDSLDPPMPIGPIIIDTDLTIADGDPIQGDGLVIGQEQDNVGGGFELIDSFKGSLDEFRIWNRALSGSEIALLAGGGFSEATGWNQDTMSFRCDAGTDFDSHIYQYQYNNANSYNLYGALEYVGPNTGNTWRQRHWTFASPNDVPYAPCTNPSNCACYNYKVSCPGKIQDADGNTYSTISINNQCWMKENLKRGTRIAGSSNQTNNSIVEKYCYDNNDANCSTYGGLYQWDEAMNYSATEGAQGICPAGWHIPTDAEQYALENYLKVIGQSCDAARNGVWQCATAGTKLKSGGSSGFEGLLAGDRDTAGSFLDRDKLAYFWSSNQSVAATAFHRYLFSLDSAVLRGNSSKTYGFSIRCIKD